MGRQKRTKTAQKSRSQAKRKTRWKLQKPETAHFGWRTYALIFLGMSAVGWIFEVVLTLVKTGQFVNRGFLYGPWLPIYGTGVILMIIVNRHDRNWLSCFIKSAVVVGLVEYLTSWWMEVAFGTRWWDYSDLWLNVNGRICLLSLLGFGIGGCVVMALLPRIERLIAKIPQRVQTGVIVVLGILFAVDVVCSFVMPHMLEFF